MEDKINYFLKKIKDLNLLSQQTFDNLRVSGSSPGILYGLPKIHKPDFCHKFQFRPIFSACNTPSFKLAKFLVPILSPLTRNQYTVDNSSEFARKLKEFSNAGSYFMTSFDIENLFTNVPLTETIDICLSKLFPNQDSLVIGLSRKLFKSLLELSVLNSFFMFNNRFYKQIQGLGMGLPLGPTFANIFMCHHEQNWLGNCPDDFKPVLYNRYVDDTFVLFKDPSHAPLFHNYINSMHPNIRFTVDRECQNHLPFLDCNVNRKTNCFDISVYRKNTFSGLGLSFFSFCSFNFKVNSIKTLLARAYSICSTYQNFHEELVFLRNFFKNNGYPIILFENCINKFLDKKYSDSNSDDSSPLEKQYISLPYFGSQSNKLKQELSSLLQKFFPNKSFHIILVNPFKIGNFFRYKETLPSSLRSCVIYNYCCPQCGSEYVGSTARTLGCRISEHKGVSYRTGARLSQPSHSAVRAHSEQCDVRIRDEHFKILDTFPSSNMVLRILESLHIFHKQPKLNDMSSAFPLYIINRR